MLLYQVCEGQLGEREREKGSSDGGSGLLHFGGSSRCVLVVERIFDNILVICDWRAIFSHGLPPIMYHYGK